MDTTVVTIGLNLIFSGYALKSLAEKIDKRYCTTTFILRVHFNDAMPVPKNNALVVNTLFKKH
jgi:hypothetical protein